LLSPREESEKETKKSSRKRPHCSTQDDTLSANEVLEAIEALTPIDTVDRLDQFIVGQAAAKRAVAVALRNRWRRHQLPDDLKPEVHLFEAGARLPSLKWRE
jgi:ATP-dependent protease Clp ATPase subunit